MPGSVDDPVSLDPFQDIVEVGWGGLTHIAFSLGIQVRFTGDQGGLCTPRGADYGNSFIPFRSSTYVLSVEYNRVLIEIAGRLHDGRWINSIDTPEGPGPAILSQLPAAPAKIDFTPWTIEGASITPGSAIPKGVFAIDGGALGPIKNAFAIGANFLTGGAAYYSILAPFFTSGPVCTAAYTDLGDTGFNVEEALINGDVTVPASWTPISAARAAISFAGMDIVYRKKHFVFEGLQVSSGETAPIPVGGTVPVAQELYVLLKREETST